MFGPQIDRACGAPDGSNAVRIEIRDQLGAPQALGATASFFVGADSVSSFRAYDPLYINGGFAGVVYRVRVSKPYYADVVANWLYAPVGECGQPRAPVNVAVALPLLEGAPPVRSVYIPATQNGALLGEVVVFDRGSSYTESVAFKSVVDADPGLSHGVRWTLTGDTASVGFDTTTGIATYRCLPTSGHLTLTATALADSMISFHVPIVVQGHPVRAGDPPCS